MKKEKKQNAIPVVYEPAQDTSLSPVSVSNSIELKYKDVSLKSQGIEACLITAGTVIAATVIIAGTLRK